MGGKYTVKTIGTSLLGLFLVGALLFWTGTAQALFRFIGAELRSDGVVVSKGASSLELRTSGSTWPLTIVVTPSTSFGGGYTGMDSVQAGDDVRVVADRSSGEFVALEVSKTADQSSYGTAPCDSFVIATAVYERPVNDTFYVVKDNIGVKIMSDSDTQVVGGTFDDLLPGAEVVVSGYDCRTTESLTAQTIEIIKNDSLAACNSYGQDAVVVRNRGVLLAHDAQSASITLKAAVPAGRYRVHGVSFDNHSTSPWDTQPNERWRVVGFSDTSQLFSSDPTDDLPNGIDYNQTVLSEDVEVDNLDTIRLEHVAQIGAEGYQSVYPICVVFEPLDTAELLDRR